MADFLKFLNDNAGAFNVAFSGVVAVATVVYAILTARLVRGTERLRAAATEPSLEVTYRSRDEAMALLELVVKNIGSGPAYGIRFELSAAPEGTGADELLKPLREMKALQSGMNVLMPGQEFSAYWTDVRQHFDAKLQTLVTARSTCTGVSGVKYKRDHLIDLSELKGAPRLGTPSLLAIARSLEKLQNDVHSFTTGSQRLKIDAYSETDRVRERTEWEEQRAQFIAQQTASSSNEG
jgi:hypothetical protein